MKIIDVKPHTEAWFRWRDTGLGGSEAPGIMGAPGAFRTAEEIWALKTGRSLPQKSSSQMRRGLDLEPLAREWYENKTGILMPAANIQSSEFPVMLGSLDGLNQTASGLIEIKCPGNVNHSVAKAGKIPARDIWQCVHLLLATALTWLDFVSFDGKNGAIVRLYRDTKLESQLISAEKVFWKCVIDDVPPPKKEPLKIEGTFQERAAKILAFKRSKQ